MLFRSCVRCWYPDAPLPDPVLWQCVAFLHLPGVDLREGVAGEGGRSRSQDAGWYGSQMACPDHYWRAAVNRTLWSRQSWHFWVGACALLRRHQPRQGPRSDPQDLGDEGAGTKVCRDAAAVEGLDAWGICFSAPWSLDSVQGYRGWASCAFQCAAPAWKAACFCTVGAAAKRERARRWQGRAGEVHAVFPRRHLSFQNHFWKLSSKKCNLMRFGRWDVETVHAAGARSTFPSQKRLKLAVSEHF